MNEVRLIDANSLKRVIKTECNPYGNPTIDFESGKKVLNIIDNTPTIDTTFRRGKWLKYTGNGKLQYMCSNCSAEEKNPNEANYCFYCGTKMEGIEE